MNIDDYWLHKYDYYCINLSGLISVLLCVAYFFDNSWDTGTSTWDKSAQNQVVSAKLSLKDSAKVWRYWAELWPISTKKIINGKKMNLFKLNKIHFHNHLAWIVVCPLVWIFLIYSQVVLNSLSWGLFICMYISSFCSFIRQFSMLRFILLCRVRTSKNVEHLQHR